LPTADGTLAGVGAAAVLGVLVLAVDLAVLVAAAFGLLATTDAAVEMPLICIIACLQRTGLTGRASAGSSRSLM
jgi:hypothetical protein